MSIIKIILLGGVCENGKNMYVVEVGEDIFILDCGLKYFENELLGIDVVILDFMYLEENIDCVVGVFLIYGYVDVIGVFFYLLLKIFVLVFGMELMIELVKLNVSCNEVVKGFKDFYVVDEYIEIDFGEIVVSFFCIIYMILDLVGINLKIKEGSIVYMGDFKFD